jgi:hypothetical protein
MAQYGQTNWRRSSRGGTRFVKQDEVKKLSDQVVAEIIKLFKEKTKSTTKELLMIYCYVLRINSKIDIYRRSKKILWKLLF